jgi:hypothetical protein
MPLNIQFEPETPMATMLRGLMARATPAVSGVGATAGTVPPPPPPPVNLPPQVVAQAQREPRKWR